MCGIAGILGRADGDVVGAMLTAMAHRGPDDEGLWVGRDVALGQRRLAIIDVSPAGHQPMAWADGDIQIVFNGEIYNFASERAALEASGVRFRGHSDTEVVLALYERYGERFFERLRGMFAIALYDRRGGPGREKLLLARDPFGIKPLLYADVRGALVFASELKGLLASGLIDRRIDPVALRQLLSLGSVYQPRTLVAGVSALPAGHVLVQDAHGRRIRPFWSPALDRVGGLRRRPYDEQVEYVRAALVESVRLQMVADVPVGAFLSGGIDSSLIVALMAREAGGRVKTFSVGFESGAGVADESYAAADIARHLETDHTRVAVTGADARAAFEHFVTGLDQPSVDGFNSYFVTRAAAGGVTVALSGTGGDELFLGYPWFAHIERQFGNGPIETRSWWQAALVRLRSSAPSAAGAAFREAYGRLYHGFGPAVGDTLLAAGHRDATELRGFAEDLAPVDLLPDAGALERASALCLAGYMRQQLLRDIDAVAMSHSLEVRVPFLDPVIADIAYSLPTATKLDVTPRTLEPGASYRDSGVKKIICDAARPYLPPDFFGARQKTGFNMPNDLWLRGPLADMLADSLAPAAVAAAGLFDPRAVAAVRDGFQRRERPWAQPWLLMVTEQWRRHILAAPVAKAPARAPEATVHGH
jgi:asparagine synthase (glutamine-hydrolysing)